MQKLLITGQQAIALKIATMKILLII